jgi:hypothetical protein
MGARKRKTAERARIFPTALGLLDRERALHAGVGVVSDRTVELILARLERRRNARRSAGPTTALSFSTPFPSISTACGAVALEGFFITIVTLPAFVDRELLSNLSAPPGSTLSLSMVPPPAPAFASSPVASRDP